jgi:hypothetical protein
VKEKDFGQAFFDDLGEAVVTECRDCGAVIQSGQVFCFEHDPKGA